MDLNSEPKLNNDETDWSDETDADEHARDDPNKRSNKSPKKKRKRDEDLSNEERPKKLATREKSRLCSAPAYLYMVLADGGPAFKWRDGRGQAASGRSVKYYDGLTAEGAFIEALQWHDAYERRRFTEDNEKVIIALARRRVRNWADSGSEGMAAIGRRGSDDAAKFETVCSKTQMSTRQRDILVVMSENASILSSLEVMWLWKDECRQAAPKGCVNFHRGLVMQDWKVRCITKFDLHEHQITDNYNNDKLIAMGRGKFAQNIDDIQLRLPDLIRPKIRAILHKTSHLSGGSSGLDPDIESPSFPGKKLKESLVEAGTWAQNLFKENGKETQDEPREPPSKKRKREDKGKKNAKAFLSVVVNEKSGEPRWQWKDICGQAASNDLVNFRKGLTFDDWQMRCLKNYDHHEQRLSHYKKSRVVLHKMGRLLGDSKTKTMPNKKRKRGRTKDREAAEAARVEPLWRNGVSLHGLCRWCLRPSHKSVFFEEVFRDWQSDQDADIALPKFERKLNHSSVQPPTQRRCRKNVRLCSDKACLGIIWNKALGEPKWTWKDKRRTANLSTYTTTSISSLGRIDV